VDGDINAMSENRLDEQERKEAEKYDRRAEQILQDESQGELFVDSSHWTKITNAVQPFGAYVASIKSLGDLEGKRVLELGCGTGWLTVILCKLGAVVDGIDISGELVKIAANRVRINNIQNQANFHVMSANRLAFPDETFDRVYGLSLLHHVDIKECMPEVRRVLKKGGKAVFTEPVINNQFVEAIRKMLPIPIDDDAVFPAPPLTDKDVHYITERFNASHVTYFRLFSSLDRIIRNEGVIRALESVDSLLLRAWPFRRLARQVVMELDN
jgi:SAM-dependent methyltransferase